MRNVPLSGHSSIEHFFNQRRRSSRRRRTRISSVVATPFGIKRQSSVVRLADAEPRIERFVFDCSPLKLPPTFVRNAQRFQGSF
jgi:hypothetical protein